MSLDAAVRHFLYVWDKGEDLDGAIKELRRVVAEVELYRVIYTSRSLIPNGEDRALLEQCVANNFNRNITGVLMRHESHYIQILEGHKPKILDLLKTIEKDPRHTDFVLVKADTVDHRLFAGWSMATKEITPQEYAMWQATFSAGNRYIDKLVTSFFDGRYKK